MLAVPLESAVCEVRIKTRLRGTISPQNDENPVMPSRPIRPTSSRCSCNGDDRCSPLR